MDRREFVKMIGIGGLLAGMGALLGSGCAREPEPEAEAPPVAGEAPAPEAAEMMTTCPNCGAENKVEQWGVPITCWKCGHKWTPEKPA